MPSGFFTWARLRSVNETVSRFSTVFCSILPLTLLPNELPAGSLVDGRFDSLGHPLQNFFERQRLEVADLFDEERIGIARAEEFERHR